MIKVQTQNTGVDVIICVSDNGIGIPENFSVENTDSVGISIIKSIISQLHGTLQYRKITGTEITITFPKPTIMPLVSQDLDASI